MMFDVYDAVERKCHQEFTYRTNSACVSDSFWFHVLEETGQKPVGAPWRLRDFRHLNDFIPRQCTKPDSERNQRCL